MFEKTTGVTEIDTHLVEMDVNFLVFDRLSFELYKEFTFTIHNTDWNNTIIQYRLLLMVQVHFLIRLELNIHK